MKVLLHQSRTVRLAHKLPNGRTRVQEVRLVPRFEGDQVMRWDCFGPIFEVKTGELELPTGLFQPLFTSKNWPGVKGKRRMSDDDMTRLNSTRGLSLHKVLSNHPDVTRRGLRPSVTDYNLGIKLGVLVGAPIVPVGK